MDYQSFFDEISKTKKPECLNCSYWYPLVKIRDDIKAMAYDVDGIYHNGDIQQIEKVIREMQIKKVIKIQWDFGEIEVDKIMEEALYEKDEYGWNFPWLSETYYFDESKKWLIYTSHEGTLAFAGEVICELASKHIDKKYLI